MLLQVRSGPTRTNFLVAVAALAALAVAFALVPTADAQTACVGNDCFSNAVALSPGSVSVNTTGFTLQSGEPRPCGTIGRTAWYTYSVGSTAPGATATLDTAGSSFDTVVAVYTGSTLSSLTNVGCNDDPVPGQTRARLNFTCTSGTTYRIQLGGYQNASGLAQLSLAGCAGVVIGPSPPADLAAASDPNRVRITLTWTPDNDPYTTYYHVYRGTSNASQTLYRTVAKDGPFVDTNVSYNTRYWYSMSGVSLMAGEGQRGPSVHALTACLSGSSNDCFANATALSTVRPLEFTVNMTGATRETNESTGCGQSTNTVWVRFTATTDGLARLERVSGEVARVAAYTGTAFANLAQRACATVDGADLEFECVAGTTYRLQIMATSEFPTTGTRLRLDGCGPVTQMIGTGDPLAWDIHQSSSETPCEDFRPCEDNVVFEVTVRGRADRSPATDLSSPIVTAEVDAYGSSPVGSRSAQVGLFLAPPQPPSPPGGGVPDPDELVAFANDMAAWAAKAVTVG